ncbi:penicillin-binding protein 4 [Sporosarcina sp. NCCP-2222]|uniref:transglycosylase domain-containing protein n=1 Tax=Sporosarcina sp. NCCP-2222 TaxID=2935073 RepID=UPI00208D484B|nr:transglycosylase domain-containing protein [Sporosarcina sp. NCCP-2222]GKV56915.1 penicillin-binding protein 4 [Sporosarcina sp. NCCP-2222]
MKQLIGLGFIFLCIPLLWGVQHSIASELSKAQSAHAELQDSLEFTEQQNSLPIIIKDRNGIIVAEQYAEWRHPLELSSIPLFIQQLFITSEDRGFYEHRGYDVSAIARAFAVNAAADDRKQGGSTITQQVVRMNFLTTEKTYERKFRELLYAAEMEKQLSKDEILEMYVNDMYFGHRVYGIGAAATYFFSRPLEQLNEAEMAFLSAIPNNPSLYDPVRHFDQTKKRQELLLNLMAQEGIITDEECEAYKKYPVRLSLKKKARGFDAYSSYVLAELEDLVSDAEGFTNKIQSAASPEEKEEIERNLQKRTTEIAQSGIVIDTALLPNKQLHDEKAMDALLPANGLQAGAVVIDNDTREIVSIYAGKGYRKADFNRAYQAYRQPGSAIKPLLVYGPYLESGPYSERTPIDSSNICVGSYCPTNIGGYRYGITTLGEAFRYSHNTAAVRLLLTVGLDRAFDSLTPFQFKMVTEKDKTYSAALGGFSKGVTPLEMASAYSSFIDGTYQPAHAIRAVTTYDGEALYKWDDKRETVWSSSTTATMRSMMNDVVRNGTGKGIRLTTSYTGAKTGTTNHYKDIWIAGFNDRFTTAVWIGRDTPQPIKYASDQKIHVRAFNALIEE